MLLPASLNAVLHGGRGTPLPLAFGERSASLKSPPATTVFCVSPRSGSEAWKAQSVFSRHCVTPRSEAFRSGTETEFEIRGAGAFVFVDLLAHYV